MTTTPPAIPPPEVLAIVPGDCLDRPGVLRDLAAFCTAGWTAARTGRVTPIYQSIGVPTGTAAP